MVNPSNTNRVMHKIEKYLFLFVITLATLVLHNVAFANMLGDNPPLWSVATFGIVVVGGLIISYIFLTSLNTLIEYFVFYLIMKKHHLNLRRTFTLYAIANFVSYLPTILVFLFSSTYLLVGIGGLDLHDVTPNAKLLTVPIILAESTAILIEVTILFIGFKKLHTKGLINIPVPIRKILLITIFANLVSLAFSPLLWSFR